MRRAPSSTRLRRLIDSPWPVPPGPRASPGGRRDQPDATRSNVAALIPAYAEERHIRDVVTRTRRHLDAAMATSAFDAETEMLAIAAGSGYAIAAAGVSTVYDDQDSRISPWRDTVRFLRLMHRLTRTARTGESA